MSTSSETTPCLGTQLPAPHRTSAVEESVDSTSASHGRRDKRPHLPLFTTCCLYKGLHDGTLASRRGTYRPAGLCRPTGIPALRIIRYRSFMCGVGIVTQPTSEARRELSSCPAGDADSRRSPSSRRDGALTAHDRAKLASAALAHQRLPDQGVSERTVPARQRARSTVAVMPPIR